MNPGLPHPWGDYLRAQSALDETTQIDNRNWGLEASANAILDAAAAGTAVTPANLARTAATIERRERHRARLRRVFHSDLVPPVDQPYAVEARVMLMQMSRLISPDEFRLLARLATGTSYQQLSRELDRSRGALRVHALRARQALARLAA